jgi:hypothetical protein
MQMLRQAQRKNRRVEPSTWQVRRKALLAVVTVVPVLLIAYSVGASLAAPEQLVNGAPLVFSALLISVIGGYVIWDSLTSLARLRVAPRRARRVLPR